MEPVDDWRHEHGVSVERLCGVGPVLILDLHLCHPTLLTCHQGMHLFNTQCLFQGVGVGGGFWNTHLALGVVGDEAWSGANGDLPDRPVGVIGQVDWQDTDSKLTLQHIQRWIVYNITENRGGRMSG